MKIAFHQRKFALNINKSTGYFWSTFITQLSTVSDLTQQIMIQTKSKGSPAFFLPQAKLGLLLRSPISFFSPFKRGTCPLATTYLGNKLKALSTKVNQKGYLRPTFSKTLTTSEQGKTATRERLTSSGIEGSVFKFPVPSLLQHFRKSVEKGVCT